MLSGQKCLDRFNVRQSDVSYCICKTLPVAPLECGATDRGQHEWPQSPSDAQPHLWQDTQQNRQSTMAHTDDYKVEVDAAMTGMSLMFKYLI